MSSFLHKTQANIEFSADLLRQSKRPVLLTGAGLSTPSGIPDFRSTGSGLWSHHEPLEVASLSTFRTTPERFYKWFYPLAGQIFNAQPNEAHLALARLEEAGYKHTILTQNIDMLHQKAGSKSVIEMHGSMKTLTCTQCYHQVDASLHLAGFIQDGSIPRCPCCNSILKPDVILFGEQLPQAAFFNAQKKTFECDLMLVIGSSLEVLPVAGFPVQALDRGAHLIFINNAPTYINPRADVVFTEDVSLIVPAIVEKILNA